eukprot:702262-Heterocapsa_arctica.AAC.1
MRRFRACFYVCTASAARWGLGSACDIVSQRCRDLATDKRIPNWSGDWFWDELGQFTTTRDCQHHGEKTGPDLSGPGADCTALSWHWDRVVAILYDNLVANTFDINLQYGWAQLMAELNHNGRHSE